MAKRKPRFSDGLVDLPLPSGGLDESAALEYQPPNTTADCQNVRGTHPINGKNALCQRSGIQPYCPVPLSGDHHVQEIHHVIVQREQAEVQKPGKIYVPTTSTIMIVGPDGSVEVTQPTSGTPGPGMIDDGGNILTVLKGSDDTFHAKRFDNRPRGTARNFNRNFGGGFGGIPQNFPDEFDPQDDQFAVVHQDDELPGGLNNGGQGQAGQIAIDFGGHEGPVGGDAGGVVGDDGPNLDDDPTDRKKNEKQKDKKKKNTKKNDNKKKRDKQGDKKKKKHTDKNRRNDDDDPEDYDDEQEDEDLTDLGSPTGGSPGGKSTTWKLKGAAALPAPSALSMSVTSLGTAQGLNQTTLTIAGVTKDAADALVVFAYGNNCGPLTGSWGATSLTLQSVDGTTTKVRFTLTTTASGTNDISITFSTAGIGADSSAVIIALKVTGSGGVPTLEINEHADSFGTSQTPGTNITVTGERMLLGAVFTQGPSTDADGTWGGSFTADQIDGTTGAQVLGVPTDIANANLSTAYRLVTSGGAYPVAKTGITSRAWVAYAMSFSAPTGVAVLTTLGVATRGGIFYALVAIDSATYLWRKNAETGELLDGSSPWLNSSTGSNKTMTWVDRSNSFNNLLAVGESKLAQISQNASGIQIRIFTRSSGAVDATTVIDATATLAAHDIAGDDSDNFYVVWGSASATQPNRLSKFNSAGVLQWTKTGSTRVFAVTYDRVHGKLYAAGTAYGGGANDLVEVDPSTGDETTGTTVTGAPYTSMAFDGRDSIILGKEDTITKMQITDS